jgi:hypothetical protein
MCTPVKLLKSRENKDYCMPNQFQARPLNSISQMAKPVASVARNNKHGATVAGRLQSWEWIQVYCAWGQLRSSDAVC